MTACTIVITTVAQGLALPLVTRWARLRAETELEEELRLAEITATEDALATMDQAQLDAEELRLSRRDLPD